jgi:hypothetical protein
VPENDAPSLISGVHVRAYASTDLRHLIVEIGASTSAATLVRLTEANARTLIGQLQSGVDMIAVLDEAAAKRRREPSR